ncbi:L,D-transpeptidase [Pseudanabaenaceae cyanobacterium LEGE 13415]|nr:L,D-transpeptidase [Pseudanabaenaceae cyanobacterium LEGE 13415]
MQRKTIWCVGILLTCATFFSPQPSFSNPVLEPVPASEPTKQPLRLEIRLRQRRVTVFQGDRKIKSYPIAVGKPGWETPTGNFTIKQKIRDPEWIHPMNGSRIPGGDPENPLGRRWIGFWTDGKNWIGFHGTPNPESIGTAASHGCIRMYNRDVEELFGKVSLGTEVIVKN